MIQERRSPSFSKMAVCTANGTTAFSFLVLLDGQGPCHNLVLQCTAVRQVYLFSMVRYDDNHTLFKCECSTVPYRTLLNISPAG